jgi:hypothetical protein
MPRNPFKKYHGFIRGSFLNFFAFRGEILGWVLQDVVTLFIMVFLWFAIYKENANAAINGFSYPEMMAYLVVASISGQWINNGSTFRSVNKDISEGQISSWLTKPVSYRGKNFACSLGNCLGNFVLFFLPLAIIALLVFTLGFRPSFPRMVQHHFLSGGGLLGDRDPRLARFFDRPARVSHQFPLWYFHHQGSDLRFPFGPGRPLLFLPRMGAKRHALSPFCGPYPQRPSISCSAAIAFKKVPSVSPFLSPGRSVSMASASTPTTG